MMLTSVVGPVEAIGCTVGTQKTFPIVPRHTLWSYLSFCATSVHPIAPCGPFNGSWHHLVNPLFFLKHPVVEVVRYLGITVVLGMIAWDLAAVARESISSNSASLGGQEVATTHHPPYTHHQAFLSIALWCQLCPVKDAAPVLSIAVF